MKIHCNIIRDLLPLYAENMVNEQTSTLVESHLLECDACRRELEELRGPVVLPKEPDHRAMDRVSKKVSKRIVALAVVLGILLGIVLVPMTFFFGNPVSWLATVVRANIYLWENYSDYEYRIKNIKYNFMQGCYTVDLEFSTDPETPYWLSCDWFGTVIGDTREPYERGLVRTELNETYTARVTPVLEALAQRYEVTRTDCRILWSGQPIPSIRKNYALDSSTLDPEQEYDCMEVGSRHGRVTVYLYDSEATPERAAELLLEIKQYLDEAGVRFYAMDFVLKTKTGGEDIWLYDFLSSDIYPEDLAHRIENADAVADIYHSMDHTSGR